MLGTASVDAQGKTVHVGDFYAPAMNAYKNIVSLLERENAVLKDIVKFTVFFKNMGDYDKLG